LTLFKRKAEQQAPAWFPGVEQRTAEWQAEDNRLAELVVTAREYRGLTADQSERMPIALKSGERVYRILDGATLVEPRSRGGHWEGRSSGVSVRITKSAAYRLGESRGVYVRAEDKPTLIDRGTAVITDRRVAFAGAKQSREWLWAKCLGVQHQFDLPWTAISVSNRQKTSGLYYGPVEAHTVRFHLDLAYAVATNHADSLVAELEEESSRPVDRLPACSRGGFLILLAGSLDKGPLLEYCAGADKSDEVGSVDGSPALLGRLDELERHRQRRRTRAGALGHPRAEPYRRERRLDRVDLRWIQCSAGKS
jgi:hypothetical protein